MPPRLDFCTCVWGGGAVFTGGFMAAPLAENIRHLDAQLNLPSEAGGDAYEDVIQLYAFRQPLATLRGAGPLANHGQLGS